MKEVQLVFIGIYLMLIALNTCSIERELDQIGSAIRTMPSRCP